MEVGSLSWILLSIALAVFNSIFLVGYIKKHQQQPTTVNKFRIVMFVLAGPGLGIFLIFRYMF